MTICSWTAYSAEMLMESIGRHAKLHIRYARRKAVFVGVLVAGDGLSCSPAASMMAGIIRCVIWFDAPFIAENFIFCGNLPRGLKARHGRSRRNRME